MAGTPRIIPSPPRLDEDTLGDWLQSLDELADEPDLDAEEDFRFAYDDPARRPLD